VTIQPPPGWVPHRLAEAWASTQSEIRRANAEWRDAENRLESLRVQLNTLSEQLSKCVGPTKPVRVFAVSFSEAVLAQQRALDQAR
jgi:hypothetical protein